MRRWLAEKYVWHLGEQWRLSRAATARGMGLPGAEFAQPEPGTIVNMTTNSTQTTAACQPAPPGRPLGWLMALLVLLPLLAAGLVLAVLLSRSPRSDPTTTPTPAAPPPAAKAPGVDPIELELQWWTDEKGQVHFGTPTPVQTPAP